MKIGEPFNPFGLFNAIHTPNWVARIRGLSQGAKQCYGRLVQYAGQNGYCWPSQDALADELGVTARQTRDYLRELEKWELIRTEQRGLQRSNVYVFLWHKTAELSTRIPEPQARSGPEQVFRSKAEPSLRSGAEQKRRSYRRESFEENQKEENQGNYMLAPDICSWCHGRGELGTGSSRSQCGICRGTGTAKAASSAGSTGRAGKSK